MPIAGLTTKNDLTISRGLNQFGVIRKGEPMGKTTDGRNKPGRPLNYFRFVFEDTYKDLEKVMPHIFKTDEIKEFKCLLVGDTLNTVFPTWNEAWSAKGLLHQCDGVTQNVCWDQAQLKYTDSPVPCAGGEKPHYECVAECRRIGRLYITIPAINDAAGETGVFALKTGSFNDIKYMGNRLHMLEQVVGGLNFLPVTIGRSEQKKTRPDKEYGRTPATFSLVYINVENQDIVRYVDRKTRLLGERVDMLELVNVVDQVNQPRLLESGDDQPEDNEVVGIDPEPIAEWLQGKLGWTITAVDVADIFHSNRFNYVDAKPDMKMFGVALVLEAWNTDQRGVNLDNIEAQAKMLLPTSPDAVKYIMDVVTGTSE